MPIANNPRLSGTQSTSNKLDPNYVTGFTVALQRRARDVSIWGISPDSKLSSGFRIKLSFQIGLPLFTPVFLLVLWLRR